MIAARTIVRSLARAGSKAPYRRITIHRYTPSLKFGSLTGLLDFSPTNISEMIEAGYRTAVEHDCVAAGCEIPNEYPPNSNNSRIWRESGRQVCEETLE